MVVVVLLALLMVVLLALLMVVLLALLMVLLLVLLALLLRRLRLVLASTPCYVPVRAGGGTARREAFRPPAEKQHDVLYVLCRGFTRWCRAFYLAQGSESPRVVPMTPSKSRRSDGFGG